MSVWLDGLNALSLNAWTVTCVLFMVVWGQIIVLRWIERLFPLRLNDAEKISLSMAGWIIPLTGWAVLSFGAVLLFGEVVGRLLSFLLIGISLIPSFKRFAKPSFPAAVLILFFAASLVLRFAFLHEAILPSYFDSAEHYRIIEELSGMRTFSVGVLVRYYHVGYHLVSAALVQIFHLKAIDLMLVFGQVILAALPMPAYFIVKRITGSDPAGVFACLLAGFAWHMPAHLVNWGKYPALLSLAGLQFTLAVCWLIYGTEGFRVRRIAQYFPAGLAALIMVFIHTRSVIVFVLVLTAAFLTSWRKRRSSTLQIYSIALVLIILAVEMSLVWNNLALRSLLEGYLQNDALTLALILPLVIFSAWFYSDLTFLLLACLVLVLSGLFISFQLPTYGIVTLLDRPYVQMLTYLPLSILGGLGLAGMTEWIRRLFPRSSLPARLLVFSTLGFVIFNASLHQGFYPSKCCVLVSRDDLAAIAWMDNTLPADANILAASGGLSVTSLEASGNRTGVDGGIWIAPLTSRRVTLAWQGFDFGTPETHSLLCQQDLDYIYAGGMPQSFNHAQLDGLQDKYRAVFSLPGARVYRVSDCE